MYFAKHHKAYQIRKRQFSLIRISIYELINQAQENITVIDKKNNY